MKPPELCMCEKANPVNYGFFDGVGIPGVLLKMTSPGSGFGAYVKACHACGRIDTNERAVERLVDLARIGHEHNQIDLGFLLKASRTPLPKGFLIEANWSHPGKCWRDKRGWYPSKELAVRPFETEKEAADHIATRFNSALVDLSKVVEAAGGRP